jgi:chemotaxis protein methyltransferase CheR
MSPALSPQLFAILSGLVEERLGIHYGPEDAQIFADKLDARVHDAGFENALDYYYFLRYDPASTAELDALADALVVGETYFFRELDSLRAGVERAILPALAKHGRARAWSAACATGEEPLSLAMVLEELGVRDRCDIVATDVSARALARAREADYGPRSLRVLPPNPPPSGFSERLESIAAATLMRDSKRAQAARSMVDSIKYMQLNLIDTAAVEALGSFDLVLCRNVLIYFADTTVKRVVGTLASALGDDGRLVIGTSESLLRFGTLLHCEERGGTFLYAKGLR